MELSTVAALASRSAFQGSSETATLMLRKVLDIQANQSAQLAQMMAQSSGLGQSLDIRA